MYLHMFIVPISLCPDKFCIDELLKFLILVHILSIHSFIENVINMNTLSTKINMSMFS